MEDSEHLRSIIQNTSHHNEFERRTLFRNPNIKLSEVERELRAHYKISCEKARLGPERTLFLLPAVKWAAAAEEMGVAEKEERPGQIKIRGQTWGGNC